MSQASTPTATGAELFVPNTVTGPVTFTGQTFKGVTKVAFGYGTERATLTVNADGTSLTAAVPRNATTGPIAITNAGGTTASATFTADA